MMTAQDSSPKPNKATGIEAGAEAGDQLDFETLKEWLRPIEDPEIRMSLTELGLIYEGHVDAGGKAWIKMTLTTPACPAAGYIVQMVRDRLLEHERIDEAEVELVWEPKWDPREHASEEAKDVLGIW